MNPDGTDQKVIVNDDLKRKFLSVAAQVVRLYKAILPDPKANDFAPIKTCIAVLADKIRTFTEEASIEDLMEKVGQLLDESIATVCSTNAPLKTVVGNPASLSLRL